MIRYKNHVNTLLALEA